MGQLSEWLNTASTTSDDQRRARLLNVLLLGFVILCLVVLAGTIIYQLNSTLSPQEAAISYWAGLAFLLSSAIVFLINRYWSGKIAAWLFLLILTLIIYYSDTPYESTWGRNMVTMILPVLIAGVILRPGASFVMAGFISVIFYIAAAMEAFEPNFLGAITFFATAFVAWLSSHVLERALQKLRQSLAEAVTAQEEIRQQRQFLRQVIDINPHFIFAKDRNGRYTLANQSLAAAYGTTVDNLLGKTDADFTLDLEKARQYRNEDLAVINTQQERFIPEESMTDAAGQLRWLQTIKRPLVNVAGVADQALSVTIDITERKLAEDMLHLNAQRLQILHEIDQTILAADSLQSVAQIALNNLGQLIPSLYTASVLTFEYETNRALILAAIDQQKEPTMSTGHTIPIYDRDLFQRLRQGEQVYDADLTQHHESNQTERQIRETGIISYLISPLLVEGQLLGALYLSSGQPHAFTGYVFEIGREIAAQLAIAIRQDQLRQQAERNMAELERQVDEQTVALRLRNRALESSAVGVSIADARQPDAPIIYANPALTEITGYRMDEIIGRNSRFLQGSEPGQSGLNEVRAAIREERDCHVIVRNYRKDGTLFYNELTLSPVRDASSKVSHFVGITRDVTRHQLAEEALKQNEETLRILLNATTDVALLMDREGKVLIYNEPLSHLLGKPDTEIKGVNVYDLAPPDVSTLRRQRVEEVIASGQPASYEEMFGDLVFDYIIYPILDGNGRVVQLAFFGHNVTERKQAEANLRQALEQEKELNQLKSRFVSMTSHEFRTPLTTILSSVGLLEYASDTMPPERRLKHYDKMRTAVTHMTGLLDDVLFIGKAESERLEFRPEPVDIKQLCLDITEEMQLAVRETHHIHFTADFEPEQLLLDRSLMRQILTNLLSNAIKYSPQGGTVTFSLSTEANCLVLRVRDQGIGIPERDKTRLFESFQRAANVGNISGTGLGLTIVHKAVTLHSGAVHFTSEEGQGTEFVVEIPISREEALL